MNRSLSVGITIATVLVAGSAVAVAAPHALAKPTHSLSIDFPTASGLVAGSDVFEAGAKIGTVSSITPTENDRALITVAVQDEHWPLHQGLTAGIRPKSLLGEKYVDLHDGSQSAPAYNATATLHAAGDSVPVELDQFINSLDSDTRAAAKVLLNDLGAGIAGRGQDLNAAIQTGRQNLDHLAVTGQTLNNRDPDLDRILVGLDGVLSKLTTDDQLNQMSQLIDNGQQTLNALQQESASFKRQFIDSEAALADLNAGLDPAIGSLRTIIDTLSASGAQGGLLANLTQEANLLASAGSNLTSGSGLSALEGALVGGPTASGGALEKLAQPDPKTGMQYMPIFRVCLINPLPSSCTGDQQLPTFPAPPGYQYGSTGAGSDMSTLASFIGA